MAAHRQSDLVPVLVEAYRLHLLRGLESSLYNCGYDVIAGVDEVGRGCLAGPVVAAAVVVDPRCAVPGIDDSKRLDAATRERLAPQIRRSSLAVAWAASSAATIDQINVLEATRLAMCRALEQLSIRPDLALVDAVPLDALCPVLPVVRGDSLSYAIACASIIAKCERDRLMEQLDSRYPQYGFAANKGYGAPQHRQALVELGPTPIHRLTFRSVVPRRPLIRNRGDRLRTAAAVRPVRPLKMRSSESTDRSHRPTTIPMTPAAVTPAAVTPAAVQPVGPAAGSPSGRK